LIQLARAQTVEASATSWSRPSEDAEKVGIAQGLKLIDLTGFIGTTKVVPFHKAFRSGLFQHPPSSLRACLAQAGIKRAIGLKFTSLSKLANHLA